MSISISNPFKLVQPSANISSLFAAHSPIIITAYRRDVEISTTQNSGGFVQVTTVDPFTHQVGDTIYIQSGGIDTACKITVVTDPYIFTTDLVYSSGTADGYVNNFTQRPNYYIETIIKKLDSTLTFYTEIGRMISRPNAKGVAKIDITRLCKLTVDMTDIISHGVINEIDHHLSSQVATVFTEMWTGSTEAPVGGATYYLINGAMQIGHVYDSNMADYWLIADGSALGKWVAASSKLRYYHGYPFDVAFYFPFNLNPTTLERSTDNMVDGQVISTTNSALDISKHSFINRMTITMVRTGGSIYGQKVRVKCDSVTVTQDIEIRDTHVCKNPFYVKWVCSEGSWNYFMFMHTQLKGRKTRDLGEFGRFIEALSSAETDTEYLGKESVPHITFGSDSLDTYDIELMESLIDSPKVQYLTNPLTWVSEGQKWQTIKVDVGNFLTRVTKHSKGKIELRASLPEKKLQTQ